MAETPALLYEEVPSENKREDQMSRRSNSIGAGRSKDFVVIVIEKLTEQVDLVDYTKIRKIRCCFVLPKL